MKVGDVDASLCDVAGRPFGEKTIEGVLDVHRRTVGHENGGEMGPPDDRTPGCLRDLREGDRQPVIPQPLCKQLVSACSVQAEPLELGLQRPSPGSTK